MRHWAQMDWELTMWQMVYLCFQPNKVYNTTKYHKRTQRMLEEPIERHTGDISVLTQTPLLF